MQKQFFFQAFKTWEHNGRQVGQLWMLSETTLKKECKKYNLDEDGNKIELITRLGRTIKDRERKMLTMGPAHEKLISHDVTPIHKVDEEDLPKVLKKFQIISDIDYHNYHSSLKGYLTLSLLKIFQARYTSVQSPAQRATQLAV